MQTIEQTVELPILSDQLFDAYLDPIEHARITGSAVRVGREVGPAEERMARDLLENERSMA